VSFEELIAVTHGFPARAQANNKVSCLRCTG
jgi:hypothetical protein